MRIRGTPTDSLSDVIQSLQLVRKSGILTVERDGPGNFSELGTITFRDGQPVAAEIGPVQGAEALRRLVNWGACRFVFEAAPPIAFSPSAPPNSGPLSSGGVRRYQDTSNSLREYSPSYIVPYRAPHMERIVPDFQRLGLSRLHRQLFLLIDGRRSSQELARLIGRHSQEVLLLLADLERLNLIGH